MSIQKFFEVLFCNLLFDIYDSKYLSYEPIVINTWPFYNCTNKAWEIIENNGSALDAVEAGCNICEQGQCSRSVGYGGHIDENGETTLDAMIMDGESQEMGAVGSLYKIKNAISVARKIMDYTQHSFLVGEAATKFALQMGFEEENLTTNYSIKEFKNWLDNKCQPNFRKNVLPDPKKNCGPYHQNVYQNIERSKEDLASDTVGVIALDFNRKIAIGMSTNGADHKIPGRVGDSPIPGSGGYADNSFGAAVATGDGDIMMRFLPCYQAVENLRNGMTPIDAANNSLQKIIKKIPSFYGAIIVMDKFGNHSASCHGWDTFTYTYRTREKSARFIDIKCSKIR